MTQRIFFLFPDKVHLLDINGPIHIFYEAMEMGADLSLIFLGLTGKQVESSAGLSFANLQSWEDFELGPEDWIIVPGFDKRLIDNPELIGQLKPFYKWVHKQHQHGTNICSVCTGAYLLAQSGILEHRKCTTHWKYLEDFEIKFPKVVLLRNRLFVKDGNLYSSAGVTSGIDLSLFILEEIYGSTLAAKVAKEVVVYLRRTENDPQLSVFLQYRNHLHDRVHQVQDLLGQHLDRGFKIEELAERVCMSPRNLTRLFKKSTGITIGKYHEKLRIELASSLLAQGHKVEAVARDCGYSDATQLRDLLKKQSGNHPADFILSS